MTVYVMLYLSMGKQHGWFDKEQTGSFGYEFWFHNGDIGLPQKIIAVQ